MDDRQVVAEPVDAGVVAVPYPTRTFGSSGVAGARQQRSDRGGGELAAAAGAVGERGQRDSHPPMIHHRVADRAYTNDELDAAVAALTDPAD